MPESQPSFLTVRPDGSTAPVFPGGVEIPIPVSTTPQSGTDIAWTDGPGGAKVAQNYARRYIQTVGGVPGVRNENIMQSNYEPGDRASTAILFSAMEQAAHPGSTFQSELRTQADASGSSFTIPGASVFALARDTFTGQDESPDIITDLGRSDFVQHSNFYGVWAPAAATGWVNVNNTVPVGSILGDPYNGVPFTIPIIPPFNCYFIAMAKVIWSSPDAIWSSVQWGLHFTPTIAAGPNLKGGIFYNSGGFDWTLTGDSVHRDASYSYGSINHFGCLPGGVQTNVDLAFWNSSNNNQQYYLDYRFLQLFVITFGRWHDYANP